MTILTEHLELFPLTADDLALYLQGAQLFETRADLKKTSRTVIAGIRDRVRRTTLAEMRKARGDDWLFYTFWIVVTRTDKMIVAELGFKGLPDEDGTVEIGYGTMPEARNRGYMTEAVNGLAGWATGRSEVNFINAETDRENMASIRVLEKNGFAFQCNCGTMKWWRLSVTAEKEHRYNYAE